MGQPETKIVRRSSSSRRLGRFPGDTCGGKKGFQEQNIRKFHNNYEKRECIIFLCRVKLNQYSMRGRIRSHPEGKMTWYRFETQWLHSNKPKLVEKLSSIVLRFEIKEGGNTLTLLKHSVAKNSLTKKSPKCKPYKWTHKHIKEITKRKKTVLQKPFYRETNRFTRKIYHYVVSLGQIQTNSPCSS